MNSLHVFLTLRDDMGDEHTLLIERRDDEGIEDEDRYALNINEHVVYVSSVDLYKLVEYIHDSID